MFANRFRKFALIAACLLPGMQAQAAEAQLVEEGLVAVDLSAPKFPVPKHVSRRAREILAKPIDLSRSQQVPRTAQQWQEARAYLHASLRSRIDEALEAPVTIEKTRLGGVAVSILTPKQLPAARRNKVLLNLHGGAYVYFGGEASILEGITLASSGYKVVAVDYRMPPEHPFPAALDDAVAVYRALLKQYAPTDIGLFGASAGGGLVAATLVSARDAGLALPAAVVLNTPWSDLSKTGDSYYTLDGVDPILSSYDGGLAAAAKLYAGEYDLKDPRLSPVYADYQAGFPPSLLITGTRDLLLSCTVRLHSTLRASGMQSDLLVFDGMWHGFGAEREMAESRRADAEILGFFQRHMPD